MEIFTLQFWLSVGAIILMDLSLGGDNAVVIAMASNRLPEKEPKKAILIGTIGAVGLRMVLTVVAVWLLTIPYLQVLGGILLISPLPSTSWHRETKTLI
ncbi:TerC family protein [Dialister hominis]|uniref:TerC family protein n=1 Tax=Dialister hominis TaxID=2582419 RepID=UPI003FEE2A60